MKYTYKIAIIAFTSALFACPLHTTEKTMYIDSKSGHEIKGTKRLRTTEQESTLAQERITKRKRWADTLHEMPCFKYPEDAEKIKKALLDRTKTLSIMISFESRCHLPAQIEFPSLISLENLGIYHSLTMDLRYDNVRLDALRPLFQAPNLKRIEFTSFLAERIMPYVCPKVQCFADFTHRDMSSSVMMGDWENIAKKHLRELRSQNKWKIQIPVASNNI